MAQRRIFAHHLSYSDDGGLTWHVLTADTPPDPATQEPTDDRD